ncbi:MAG: hypothetical protein PHH82_01135 [Candidatus ainarchaeum sp.]|nr:hypothetical protein [Candidatus ainarchaeum sp.]
MTQEFLFAFTFPFVEQSKKQILEISSSIDNVKDEDLNLISVLLEKIINKDYSFFEYILSSEDKRYLLYYPYIRIILSISNNGKYFSAFSDSYIYFTKKIISQFGIKEVANYLKIDYKLEAEKYCLNFYDYIKAKIYDESQKLTNFDVKDGKVFLSSKEFEDYISRYVSKQVVTGLPLNVIGVDKKFGVVAEKLKSQIKEIEVKYSKEDFKYFPPCVNKIIDSLNGGSPSHAERYFLATFLFKIKMPFESVLGIFSKASDYDEKIAKYQLKKIQDGNYSVSNCQKLKSIGIDCGDCNSLSPIGYYLYRKKKNKKYKTYNKENSEGTSNTKK